MPAWFVLSGCSGGGKSTLLEALADAGFATVPEPGRRIVRDGGPMPWDDIAGFARAALELARRDMADAASDGRVRFFDRGLVDAASALGAATGELALAGIAAEARDAFAAPVFLTPPWPELFGGDPERRHGFDAAVKEHDRLVRDYAALDLETVLLPRTGVAERVRFVMERLP